MNLTETKRHCLFFDGPHENPGESEESVALNLKHLDRSNLPQPRDIMIYRSTTTLCQARVGGPMFPAAPWLGPFACAHGLTGPYALLTAATNALRACGSCSRPAALAGRLTEAERERATLLAQTHTGLNALGRELLELGRSLGYPEADEVAVLDSGANDQRRALPPQAQRAPERGAASRARPPGDGGPRSRR